MITFDSGGGLAFGIEDARASCRTFVFLLAFSSSSFCFSVVEICTDTARRRRAGLSSASVSESALSLDEYFPKFQERLYTGQGQNRLSKRIEASLALTTILAEVDCSFSKSEHWEMAIVIGGEEVERCCAIKVFRPSSVTSLRRFPTNKTFFLGSGRLEEIVFQESSSSDTSKLGGGGLVKAAWRSRCSVLPPGKWLHKT